MTQTEKMKLIRKEIFDTLFSKDIPNELNDNYNLLMSDDFIKSYIIGLASRGPESFCPIFMLGLLCGQIMYKSRTESEVLEKMYNQGS